MATETVTIVNAIRDWLLMVGEQYAIHEAHHVRRPDSSLKHPRDYFVYQFERSEQTTVQPADNSAVSGTYDSTADYYATFNRQLRIECHSENGLEVMEAVLVSAWHPASNDILNAARLVLKDMPNGVENETTDDETRVDHLYTAVFGVRKNTHFTVTRENSIWANYNIDGTLTLLDDVSTVDIVATDL